MIKVYAWCFLPTDSELEATWTPPPGYVEPQFGELRFRIGGQPPLSNTTLNQPGWKRLPLMDTWADT